MAESIQDGGGLGRSRLEAGQWGPAHILLPCIPPGLAPRRIGDPTPGPVPSMTLYSPLQIQHSLRQGSWHH